MGCGLIPYMYNRFHYYKHPEGQDPVGKLVGFGQIGAITGFGLALYDAQLWSHCANAPQFLNTLGFWVVPLTGMCVTFSAVTYTLVHLRKKDDIYNYAAGALASSGVFHAWMKDTRLSAMVTCSLVLYAILKKQAILDGQSRSIIITEYNEELQRKSYFTWRNLEHRNYSSKPWWPHNKEDYYINHY